jgi:hypothetical protein
MTTYNEYPQRQKPQSNHQKTQWRIHNIYRSQQSRQTF